MNPVTRTCLSLPVVAALGLGVAGCSSDSGTSASRTTATSLASTMATAPSPSSADASSTASPSTSPSTSPIPEATEAAGATVKTAEQIATAMAMPKIKVVNVTAEADGNQLLGRPNGYTSLAALVDPAQANGQGCTSADPGTDCGAKIEVFATPAEAAKRKEYIQSLRTGGVLGTEYNTVVGTALLRVDGVATPTRAAQYKDAFEKAAR